ncbi:hypothetical protein Hanom_Chr04g00319061 [Helianthus anomalus]
MCNPTLSELCPMADCSTTARKRSTTPDAWKSHGIGNPPPPPPSDSNPSKTPG